uniref:LAM_G_DOMAIN domain-containing protein n=1 Tax=Anisakis simplex TaxID=6269 RepID=A0A0M3J7E9_ANISI
LNIDDTTPQYISKPDSSILSIPLITTTTAIPSDQSDQAIGNGKISEKNSGIVENLNNKKKIFTGYGEKFDRFVVDESEPLGNPFVEKFTRKGLDWSNGNLKLVNVQGSKLFGSDLAFRDRSVDIPLRSWFDVLNSMFVTNVNTS